ncbi:uncharacterized protein LOC131152828 isoform X2 [Malania oleifera]|uniref:uncharacterized protein LOC131152828 isoform X2 n=1 Tax=Malania oleifera TaxID=397392 RepID=UPI0025AEA2C2|nr:uncharacterized protein LOC131152828 isoform X2 [Malania oleifera]
MGLDGAGDGAGDLLDDGDGGGGDKAFAASTVSCSICLESVTDNGDRSWAKLQCGHQFHLDCIGSAFNIKGTMQCPNCRKIERGRWLYANSCRPFSEFSLDDWAHDEDLYDLSYSEMSFGVHWCPFSGLTRLPPSFDFALMQIMIYLDNMLCLLNIQPCHLLRIHAHILLTLGQSIPPLQTPVEVFLMVPISIITGMAHPYLATCQPHMLFPPWIFTITTGSIIPLPSLRPVVGELVELISLQFLLLHGWLGPILMFQDLGLLSIRSLLVTALVLELEAQLQPLLFLLTQAAMLGPGTESRLSRHTINNSSNPAIRQPCVPQSSLAPGDPTVTGVWPQSGQWPPPQTRQVVSTTSPQVHLVGTSKQKKILCQLGFTGGIGIT